MPKNLILVGAIPCGCPVLRGQFVIGQAQEPAPHWLKYFDHFALEFIDLSCDEYLGYVVSSPFPSFVFSLCDQAGICYNQHALSGTTKNETVAF